VLRLVAVLAVLMPPPATAQEFVPGAGPKAAEDPGADAPDVTHTQWDWKFGRLVAGLQYTFPLEINNACRSDQVVTVFINGLNDLTLDLNGCRLGGETRTCAKVVPPGVTEVPGTIAPETFFYYPDPFAPAATPRPFRRLAGTLVLFHEKTDTCAPARDEYNVVYEVDAQEGTVPPPPGGPERIAGAGPCQVWWNTGQRPEMIERDEQCDAEIRALAFGYVTRILVSQAAASAGDWSWLPTGEQIMRMSGRELVALKARAEAQVRA
jgi:hypothetical protein